MNTTATVATTASTSSSHPQIPLSLGSTNTFAFAKSQVSLILEPSYQVPTDDSTLLLRTLKEISAYARSLEKSVDADPRTGNHSSPDSSNSLSHHSSTTYTPVGLDPHNFTESLFSPYSIDTASSDLDVVEVELADIVKNLELEASADTFFGRSSQLALMKTALKIKEEYDSDLIQTTGGMKGEEKTVARMSIRGADFADDESGKVCAGGEVVLKTNTGGYDFPDAHIVGKKRAAFWDVYPVRVMTSSHSVQMLTTLSSGKFLPQHLHPP